MGLTSTLWFNKKLSIQVFKITGTFFNPAPYALYLAAIFPIALGTLFQNKNDLQNANDNRMTAESQMTAKLMRPEGLMTLIPKIRYYISLFTVISIILVLPATMNRASWIGVTAGAFFVFTHRYDLLNRANAYLHNTARKLIAISFVLLFIGFVRRVFVFIKERLIGWTFIDMGSYAW